MGIRQFKPVTSATRFRSVSDFAEVTKAEPERALVEPLTKTGGRNNKGHITARWRGGGHKRRYPRPDFRRGKVGIPAPGAAGGYDPNRTHRSPPPPYPAGGEAHRPRPQGAHVGDGVLSGP